MNSRDLELDIGELVLAGFPPQDTALLRAALISGLERRLAAGSPPALQSSSAQPRLEGGSITLAADAGPQALGEALAGAVYASLGGQP